MVKPISTLLLHLLFATSASPQDRSAEIDKIFAWAKADAPGCTVAVSQGGKLVHNRAYGSADLERNVPLSTDSVFDAGSVVKQFVAASTLLLVEDGKLALTDDVRKHIPELPEYGQKVTIDHLLTHTSGIRDWTALLPLSEQKTDALTLAYRQRGLNFAPGEEMSYSNTGYELLKEIVARTSGTTFGDFARKRIFEPLGMSRSAYIRDLRQVVKNRALAYDKDITGSWKMAMLFGEERGGGGALLTTARDLLTWNDALTANRLGKFVSQKIQEPATLNNGRKLGYARGLFLDEMAGRRIVWHSGSADGYKALTARFPEHGLSLAMTCNSGDGTDRISFGQQIFELFYPGTRAAEEAAAAKQRIADAPGVDVKSRTGIFVNERTGELLRLVIDDGRLRVGGGPVLAALSQDRFKRAGNQLSFMSQDEFELHFKSSDELELKSMEGKTTRYRRAVAYAPTAGDLKGFAGRYRSDEIRGAIEVAPGKEGLLIGPDHLPERRAEFRPIDRDTFQRGNIVFRFRRDASGKIAALELTNPLLRNVPYTRVP